MTEAQTGLAVWRERVKNWLDNYSRAQVLWSFFPGSLKAVAYGIGAGAGAWLIALLGGFTVAHLYVFALAGVGIYLIMWLAVQGMHAPPTPSGLPDIDVTPVKGVKTVQVFTHLEALRANPELPATIERLFEAAGWRVEKGSTSLSIHGDGVWLHGADVGDRVEALKVFGRASNTIKIDEREDGAPLQVIVGADRSGSTLAMLREANAQDLELVPKPERTVEAARVEMLNWETPNGTDTRIEYRSWVHVVFRISSRRKERGRAYIEIDAQPTPRRTRAVIAGSNWFEHETAHLVPEEEYRIPVLIAVPRRMSLWIDEQRRQFRGSGYAQNAGCYLTDETFIDWTHRNPLAPGKYRLRVLLVLGDIAHSETHTSEWRDFDVPESGHS